MGLGALVPKGKLGLGIQLALAVLAAWWWTGAPGKEEEMDFKANTAPRQSVPRHFNLRGYYRTVQKEDTGLETAATLG